MKTKILAVGLVFGLGVWALAQNSGSRPPITSSQPPILTSQPPITGGRPPVSDTNDFIQRDTNSGTAPNPVFTNSPGLNMINTNFGGAFHASNTNFGGMPNGTNWIDYTNANGTLTYNTNLPHWWEKR